MYVKRRVWPSHSVIDATARLTFPTPTFDNQCCCKHNRKTPSFGNSITVVCSAHLVLIQHGKGLNIRVDVSSQFQLSYHVLLKSAHRKATTWRMCECGNVESKNAFILKHHPVCKQECPLHLALVSTPQRYVRPLRVVKIGAHF
jgi:hypothetical protein